MYRVFHPDHDVIGRNISNFKEAAAGEDVYPYYVKHGLADVNPDTWYPLQNLLDVFNDLVQRGGEMYDFISLGMNSVEGLVLPPAVEALSLIELYQMSDAIYRMNNRGTNIGSTECVVIDDHHVLMIRRTPHPDDLWYGIGYGFAKRFLPPKTHIHSYYDTETPRRDLGGTETHIHIEWD